MILKPSRISTGGCPQSKTITETSSPLCLSAWAKSTCWSSAPPAIGIFARERIGYELKEMRHILGLRIFDLLAIHTLFVVYWIKVNNSKGITFLLQFLN